MEDDYKYEQGQTPGETLPKEQGQASEVYAAGSGFRLRLAMAILFCVLAVLALGSMLIILFLEGEGWSGEGWTFIGLFSLCFVLPLLLLAAGPMTFAFVGKKRTGANVGSIVLGSFWCALFYWSVFFVVQREFLLRSPFLMTQMFWDNPFMYEICTNGFTSFLIGPILGGELLFGIFGICSIVGGIRGYWSEPCLEQRAVKRAIQETKRAEKEAEERRRIEYAIANKQSTFTGGIFMNTLIDWVAASVTVLTLGICYPFMACWRLKWKAKHTVIDGRQQTFDGNALQFMGKYLQLLFLSSITFGIYYVLCAKVAIEKWRTLHTHFVAYPPTETQESPEGAPLAVADETVPEEKESRFDGRWYQLVGVNWLCNFVTAITLSFGQYWAHCYLERWFCKHRTIDGTRLTFDGTAMQYFGKRILWTLLTCITLGVYVFWLNINSLKWTVSHTHIVEDATTATVAA